MSEWIQQNILAIGSYAVVALMWFFNGRRNTEENAGAIQRLESSIKELVNKIDRLIDGNADIQARLADHAARLTNLERGR